MADGDPLNIPKGASRIVPPIWLLVSAGIMVAIWYWVPGTVLISPPYTYIGGIVFGLGLMLAVYAKRQFDRVGTPVRPFTESIVVVDTGPFRFSRNPMYVSMVLALIGTGIGLGKIAPFVMVPLFMIWLRVRFIQFEEQVMEERFGEGYLTYKKRVRRWL